MSEHDYDDGKINAFLLGSLPDAEAETFEELSFTSEEFADTLKIAENALIDAYIYGEMRGSILESFETHYLSSRRRREKVDFARALKVFAERSQTKSETRTFTARGFSSIWDLLAANRWQLAFAMSAVLILTFGGWWFFAARIIPTDIAFQTNPTQATPRRNEQQKNNDGDTGSMQNSNVDPQNTSKNPANRKNVNAENTYTPKDENVRLPQTRVIALILSPPLRGSSQVSSLPISRDVNEVEVSLKLEADEFPSYRVNLTDETGKSIHQTGTLRASRNSLRFRFPSNILKPGVYSFTVSGIKNGETEILSNYSFRSVIR